ncbi:DNA methyltransferase [Azospirillum argentinense]
MKARTKKNPAQAQLDLQPPEATIELRGPVGTRRAIEDESFPFERISLVAEAESWRKEVHRPVYHMHKWWAQRLGTVFRSIIIGCFAPSGSDVFDLFHRPIRIPNAIVMDPFMGSGTTVGESLKLGARAIGRDINPVAHFAVRNAMEPHPVAEVEATFRELERDLKPEIMRWHVATLKDGSKATVLYHFWVKQLPCPHCGEQVDLFSSRVFASHAYPKKYPHSKATCPDCGAVNEVLHGSTKATCNECDCNYNPTVGNCSGQSATCPKCHHGFKIAATVRSSSQPPSHRLYAKLVLTADGEKRYLATDHRDIVLYEEAVTELNTKGQGWFPKVGIEPGYNTNQALNYNYRRWDQFFNARQLLCLGMIADRIRRLPEGPVRDLFACLFSGTLEFNNIFTSYKGEGTGAVRHMFSHHILKPERTPLEANPWGTPKSSGAFSTLYSSRILRGLEYRNNPYEIGPGGEGKVFGLSVPMGHEAAATWDGFANGKSVYLSCGSSANTDIPDGSVDAVVTDPPFFDNVNYSQLADFFHVWQRHIVGNDEGTTTTRSEGEVQHGDSDEFSDRLAGVWRECRRVLKEDGIMVFSYHHSRVEGWTCVLRSLVEAGFVVTAAHPVKAEMSVASPKAAASEPIDVDSIIVCRKRSGDAEVPVSFIEEAECAAFRQVSRLVAASRKLSRNDIRVVLMGQILRVLSVANASAGIAEMNSAAPKLEAAIDRLAAIRQ